MKCQKELLILWHNSPLHLSGHSKIMRIWAVSFLHDGIKKEINDHYCNIMCLVYGPGWSQSMVFLIR